MYIYICTYTCVCVICNAPHTHTISQNNKHQAKVDVVREAMQDSLQVLLENDAKLQNLEKASEALTEQAKVCVCLWRGSVWLWLWGG
jgi:hypothetical protein